MRRGDWDVKRGEDNGEDSEMGPRADGKGTRDGGDEGTRDGDNDGDTDCVVTTHFLGDFFNRPIKWFNCTISASFSSTHNLPDFRHTDHSLQFCHTFHRLIFCPFLLLKRFIFLLHYPSHATMFTTSHVLLLQPPCFLVVVTQEGSHRCHLRICRHVNTLQLRFIPCSKNVRPKEYPCYLRLEAHSVIESIPPLRQCYGYALR